MVGITGITFFKHGSRSSCFIDERFFCPVPLSTFITVTWDGLIIIGNIVQPKLLDIKHPIGLIFTVIACKSNLRYLCHIVFGHIEIFPFIMAGNITVAFWNNDMKIFVFWCLYYYSEGHSLCGQTHSSSSAICDSQIFVKREIIVPWPPSLYYKFIIFILCWLHIANICYFLKCGQVISLSIVLYISGEFGYHFGLRIYLIHSVCLFFCKFLAGFIIPAEEIVSFLRILETEGSGYSWRNITIRSHFPVRVSLLIDIRLCRIAWINGTLDMDSIDKIGNEIKVFGYIFHFSRANISALTISSPTSEHHFLIIRVSIEFYTGVVRHCFTCILRSIIAYGKVNSTFISVIWWNCNLWLTYQDDGFRVKGYRSSRRNSAKQNFIHFGQINVFQFITFCKNKTLVSFRIERYLCQRCIATHKANSIGLVLYIMTGGKIQCHIVSIQFSFKTCKDRH